ncbi:MAG: hypothetical protein AAFO75_09690 [Pseudomonadota bacterium]
MSWPDEVMRWTPTAMQNSTTNAQCQLPNYAPRHSKMPFKVTVVAIALAWIIAALATLGSLEQSPGMDDKTNALFAQGDPTGAVGLKPTHPLTSGTTRGPEPHAVALQTTGQPSPTKPVCRVIAGSKLQPC